MLQYNSQMLSLREAVQALFRRRNTILLVFVLVFTPVAVATFTAPSVYRATAKVLLRREDKPGALNPYFSRSTQEEEMNSELQIAASRPVLEEVLRAGLQHNEYASGVLFELLGLQSDSATHLRAAAPEDFERALERLQRCVNVEAVPGANIMEISFEDLAPQRAAWFANRLVSAYAQYTAQVQGGSEAESFFSERIQTTRARLDGLERALQEYRDANQLVSYDKQESLLLEEYKSFDTQLQHARAQIEALSRKIARLRQSRAANDSLFAPSAEMDAHPSVRQLYARFTELRLQRNILLEKYLPEHRFVEEVTQQINGVRAELAAEIHRLLRLEDERLYVLRLEEEIISRRVAELRAELKALPAQQRMLEEMQLAIDNTRKIYSLLVTRQEELHVEKATDRRISRTAVINPAVAPLLPVRPLKFRNLMLGGLFSLLLGMIAAFLRELFDRTFKSPQEMTAALGMPVLATISTEEEKNAQRIHAAKKIKIDFFTSNPLTYDVPVDHKVSLHEVLHGAGPLTEFTGTTEVEIAGSSSVDASTPIEQFRGRRLLAAEVEKLRSEILLLQRNEHARIIAFASNNRGEGTSTLLANLARDFSRFDLRVLVVDMNFFHPELAAMFALPEAPGLIDVARGTHELQSVMQPIAPGRSYLLPLGDVKGAADFDWEAGMRHVQSLTPQFDLILVDLPPLQAFSSALLVARRMDGVVQVVQAEHTRIEAVQEVKSKLERSGVRVLGAVLNQRKHHLPHGLYSRL